MTRTLITGGAGFIGTNMAHRLLDAGDEVVVLDDLSRPGVDRNLRWLEGGHGDRLVVHEADLRDAAAVRRSLPGVDRVFHFAAQVAVTTSVEDPRADFGVNLTGTLNLLEELRRLRTPPPLLFTSTNKVYGGLADVQLEKRAARYVPVDPRWAEHGIGDDRPLQFCSPYGCSKGGADQYVLDYASTYGLRNVVFRMSCIYGPHQCGNEDQGWVAHLLRQAMLDEQITVFGDGCQVRDVLYVEDLLDAMLLAVGDIDRLHGHAYNLGGGPRSTLSLVELLAQIGDLEGRAPRIAHGPWRVGDQRWYVSDTRAFSAATGWSPRVGVEDGLRRLHSWLREQAGALSGSEAR
jgi:CDP-paratose 2-epimerase